jgi:hypothetical protein
MARVTKSVIGKLKGSVGDLTFRQRNGKAIVSTRPDSINAPDDDDSINRRLKFRFLTKLASSIISIDALKSIWAANVKEGNTAFNQVVADNYAGVTVDSITDQTLITPAFGFGVGITSAAVTASGIQVVTEAIGTTAGIDLDGEKTVQLGAILSLSNPVDKSVPDYYVIPLASVAQALKLDTALTFAASLSNQEALVFPKYTVRKTIYALLTLDDGGNAIHHSITMLIS